MTTINLSNERIPLYAIVIQPNATKPEDYSDETTLYDKYPKGMPTAGSTPGTTSGNTSHTHASSGSHNHTTSGANTHTHVVTTDLNDMGIFGDGSFNSTNINNAAHVHTYTSQSDAPTSSASSDGSHQHTGTNEMNHNTVFFIKNNTGVISLRKRTLSQNSLFMWPKASAPPSRFVINTDFNSRHIKGVLNGGATPTNNLGTNTHSHTDHSAHTHTVTMASHSHTVSGSSSNVSNGPSRSSGVAPNACWINHNHGPGNAAADAGGTAGTASANTTMADHVSMNHEVPYKKISYYSQSSIGLRVYGIPEGGMVMWQENPASISIPTNWQVGDGTNGTSDMRTFYPKGDGTPSGTGGSANHLHSAPGTHTHASTASGHTHSVSGNTDYATAGAAVGSGAVSRVPSPHRHSLGDTPTSSNGPTLSLLAGDTHTHDDITPEPPSITTGIIERLAVSV